MQQAVQQQRQATPPAEQKALAPAFLGQFYEIIGIIGEVGAARPRQQRLLLCELAHRPAHSNAACRAPQGTFGRVFLATSKAQPGRRLAVKYIKPGKEQEGVCATALRVGTRRRPVPRCTLASRWCPCPCPGGQD